MQKKSVNKVSIIFLVILIYPVYLGLIAQTKKDELNTKRDKLIKEIEYSTKLLNSTSDKKGKTIQRLSIIDKKLSQRAELINIYKDQISLMEIKIADKEKRINKLNNELIHQKKLYADFIYYAYKNVNNYNSTVYLLASSTLNQFYMRKKYMDQLREARLKRIEVIDAIKVRIDYEVNTLIKDKDLKTASLKSLSVEQKKLASEKKEREIKIYELSQEEKSLKAEIDEKRKIEKEIEKMIESIMREEAKKNTFLALTPEQKLISDDFEKNKGRLPWPTKQGIITEKFGKHPHPVMPSVETFSSGIDITTAQDEYVRAIFNGTVSRIFSIKGAKYTVIVRHGAYSSVYHNLTELKVNEGDEVKTKDIIGRVSAKNQDNSAVLHLMIWKGMEKLNPEDWISK